MKIEWINVEDRLPELEQSVLLFDDWLTVDKENRKDIRIGYLSEIRTSKSINGIINKLEWSGTEFAFNITHWMPLPEPPKP